MAQSATRPTTTVLAEWTREQVAERLRELEDNIHAGRFDSDRAPDKCRMCDVTYWDEDAAG